MILETPYSRFEEKRSYWANNSVFFSRFNRSSVIGSINIPFSSVTFGEVNIENLGQHSNLLKNTADKTVIVAGSKDIDFGLVRLQPSMLINSWKIFFQFSNFLLQCNIPRVCVLNGGFEALMSASPSILVHQREIWNVVQWISQFAICYSCVHEFFW